ncbi:uncharacterized protein RJT20DRAFT_127060 [Scheffersomyces xylosifermentans]|uniref:uncharacterized protein n=1 Tax=Scheffersomyces xylosifermentans TaxID=1304137 RepID=UPI00315DD36A
MASVARAGAIGLLSGLALPPLLTRFLLVPSIRQQKVDEIRHLKYQIDYMGWHVRELEEIKGYKEEDTYVPITFVPNAT